MPRQQVRLVLLSLIFLSSVPAWPCSVVGGPTPPEALVARADVIVRVSATGYGGAAVPSDPSIATPQVVDEWRWAMLAFDDCRLMLDESINPHPGSPRTSVVYLYPDDVVEFHRRAQENGLAVPDLEVSFYGMTEFRIDDPDGNRLWIGQPA